MNCALESYHKTSIWKRALAVQKKDEYQKEREYLRNAFENLRNKAKVLAEELAKDTPQFTVHSIKHLDALWDTASLIAGDKYPITPTEGFVLGAAFMIHDLGMGLAAYPKGIEGLAEETIWKDTVTKLYKDRFGRVPMEEELLHPEEEVKKAALPNVLRTLHAKHAENLLNTEWDFKGKKYRLLDDSNLRDTYGTLIGKIAHSHAMSVTDMEDYLGDTVNAPDIDEYDFPREWNVDPIKVACLLRTADAAQISANRAPTFLYALRQPQGFSDLHWKFQNKMAKPDKKGDKLKYTSTEFKKDDAESWWLCHDTLKMVDGELHSCDLLLNELGKCEFELKGVFGIEDPKRLKGLIKIEGWEPVDTQIKVSDVAGLVSRLGGEQLYGPDSEDVPLRELMQNGIDAVLARRKLESKNDDWGDVILRYGEDKQGKYVEVEDTGVGMSKEVLTGPFLDFGTSFWGSDLMHRQFPGLESRDFESIGKFGIGFYSAFILGEKLRVTTNRYDRAQNETLVLEFNHGLNSRPLLRPANELEYKREGGTTIRVWLKDEVDMSDLDADWIKESYATAEANIYYQVAEKQVKIIASNSWLYKDGYSLLQMFNSQKQISETRKDEVYASNIVDSNKKVIGRAALLPPHLSRFNSQILITVGGYKTGHLNSECMLGVVKGLPETAARDRAKLLINEENFKDWLTIQLKKHKPEQQEKSKQLYYSNIYYDAYGTVNEIYCAYSMSNWLKFYDIKNIIDNFSKDLYMTVHFYGQKVENIRKSRRTRTLIRADEVQNWQLPQSIDKNAVLFYNQVYTGFGFLAPSFYRPKDFDTQGVGIGTYIEERLQNHPNYDRQKDIYNNKHVKLLGELPNGDKVQFDGVVYKLTPKSWSQVRKSDNTLKKIWG